MDFPDSSILFDWFAETVQILQRLFIVVVAAFICIRLKALRQALHGVDLKWQHSLVAMLTFGMLAIIGTHSGVLIDIHDNGWQMELSEEVPTTLKPTEAIVGFRDTMTLVAGLIGGPLVGFGAGLIAGVERYQLGGFAGLAGSLATPLLGGFAGGVRYFRPQWITKVTGVFWIALIGTLLHRLMILSMVQPYPAALILSWIVVVPVGIVNVLGCVLFFMILRDLDRDRLENEARDARLLMVQAELRALRAQVDPHFLNNSLNDLKSLIRLNPEQARSYVVKLAEFFNSTRRFAGTDTISLADEVLQLQRFLDLQRLGLEDRLQETISVPNALFAAQVLPGCLLTLVENTLKHGFKGRPGDCRVEISAETTDADLLLHVSDNGRGMSAERLQELVNQPVESESKGGGVALYQLQQSLKLIFGDSATLSFVSTLNQGTTATIRHPFRSKAE